MNRTKAFGSSLGLSILRDNPSTPGAGMVAYVTGTYATGWQCGDIRRCLAADTTTGTVSNPSTVADRSVKNKPSTVNGTLAMTAVASAAQLVAYSGFSATNYVQEAYSADLDYGTAQWMAMGWFNTTGYGPNNLVIQSADLTNIAWNKRGTAAVTAGLTDPFGGTGAFTVSSSDSTASNNDIYQVWLSTVTAGAPYVPSAWVNRLSNTTGGLNIFNGNDSSKGQMTVDFAALGAGWQRVYPGHPAVTVVIPFTGAAGNLAGFYPKPTSATAISYGLYGPQISRGTALQPYNATAATAFNGIAPIIDRSGPSGAYWRMGVDGNGFLAAEAFDGTTTRRVTSSVAVNDGNWHQAMADYATTGAITLRLDGVQNAQTTGTALLTLTNTNALLNIGNSFALNAAFPGSIALVRTGATVPFAEQIAFMYAQERNLFQPGVNCTLPDTGAVLGVTYDDATDQIVAVTAANEAAFTGLTRTASAPAAAGSLAQAAQRSGWKLLARTGTNPGVDVTVPSLNLREQLLRRAEDAARQSGLALGRVFDYDAITAQTDFVLPVGWETSEVLSAGASKREGAAKDWTRQFDGFKETTRFAVAPGNATWVQLIARRAA